MRTIIAGSRWIRHYIIIKTAVDLSGFEISEVVSGRSGKKDINGDVIKGVDLFGEEWAKKHGIPIEPFPAEWHKYGKPAGHIRNREMADYAAEDPEGPGQLIAIWDGESPGTKNMIETAHKLGLDVYVYRLDTQTMLHLTEEAAQKVDLLLDMNGMDSDVSGVKFGVKAGGCSGFEYVLDLVEEPDENDRVFESFGQKIYCDPKSYLYVRGTTIDYTESTMDSGFKFDNPNASRSCGCGTSFTT